MPCPIFSKPVTGREIDPFDENVVRRGFVLDACDFARFCIMIIGALRRSHVCRMSVAQDLIISFNYCLVVNKLLKKLVDDFGI